MLVDLSSVTTEDLAWLLLGRLEQEAEGMTNETVEICHEVLTEAVSVLREEMNDRTPLLNLPVEILVRILEYVPDPIDCNASLEYNFRPFWQYEALDSSMLIPVTHTCRRLREVMLSTPLLWSTVVASSSLDEPIAQEFISDLILRSENVPLKVLLSPSKQFTKLVDSFYPKNAHRVQELHLTDVGHRHMKYLESLLSLESPLLRSYSFDGRAGSLSKWHTHALPIPMNAAASLRDLYINEVPLLPEIPLPNITHLALCNISLPGLHGKIEHVLRGCPNIVYLALSNDVRLDELDQDPAPLHLQHLRRLTLNTVDAYSLKFYLSLIPPTTHTIALQVLTYQPDIWTINHGPQVANCIQSPIKRLAFGGHRDWSTVDFTVSVTAVASSSVFHIVSYLAHSRKLVVREWLSHLLNLEVPSAFWAVREVWVTHGDERWTVHSESVARAIAGLPLLDTIVLSHRHSRTLMEPDLSLCPNVDDPLFNSPSLKNLRLIYYDSTGDSQLDDLKARRSRGVVRQSLAFYRMVVQLRTNAYRYFDRLVVQHEQTVEPTEEHIEVLREHFREVIVEVVDRRPSIPLPETCYETRLGPGGDFRKLVAGALW
ncbi:hypothetical protein BD311DRAFT_786938 [Dichomitus squalens]|uniref:F-box domain-containing protein n=1 Tax=Dichomitus squalens TaxID=114155 RepID=A0A4V2K100_9APHY|nr:hypothetical protein BD311DRAFT_786938 [Dichomitus squalens]